MANSYIEYMKEAFEDSEGLNADQIRKLVLETNTYFESLQNMIQSGDPKAKEEALAAALEVKTYLDAKAALAAEFAISPEELTEEQRMMVAELTSGLNIGHVGTGKVNKKIKTKKMS